MEVASGCAPVVEQFRTGLAGDQIGALRVGEDHLHLRDLLEFGEHRGERFRAAGFVGAFGLLHLQVEKHARKGLRGSVELKVSAVVMMMPAMAMAVVARNQSSVFANSDLIPPPRLRASGKTGSRRREWF